MKNLRFLLLIPFVLVAQVIAQTISVKTIPSITNEHLFTHPSYESAMGDISIAVDDELVDVYTNPAKVFGRSRTFLYIGVGIMVVEGVDGYNLLYPGSSGLRLRGTLSAYRIGVAGRLSADDDYSIVGLYHGYSVEEKARYQESEITYANRNHGWGWMAEYRRMLSDNLRAGIQLAGNWKTPDAILNYPLSDSGFDDLHGKVRAFNLGLGLSWQNESTLLGMDLIYEPAYLGIFWRGHPPVWISVLGFLDYGDGMFSGVSFEYQWLRTRQLGFSNQAFHIPVSAILGFEAIKDRLAFGGGLDIMVIEGVEGFNLLYPGSSKLKINGTLSRYRIGMAGSFYSGDDYSIVGLYHKYNVEEKARYPRSSEITNENRYHGWALNAEYRRMLSDKFRAGIQLTTIGRPTTRSRIIPFRGLLQ